jgi:diguanylate cyclase (GGDEF)-like protein
MRDLGARMRKIGAALERAALLGDWSRSHPERWRLVADGEAGLGEVVASFNLLVDALMRARAIDGAIRAYSTTLARHIEVTPLAQATLAEVLGRTDAAAGAVVVNRSGQLDVAGSIGLVNPLLLLRSEVVLRAMRDRSIIRLDIADDVIVHGALVDFRPREVVALPIVFLDAVLGVLVVASARPFAAGTLDVLDAVQQSFGVSLNNALTHEQQQVLAAIDGLTGIYNRRFGFQRLREEISQAHRSGAPLGVLMIDIDHFKAINDAHGHLVGDRVLRHVAGLVRGALRLGDVVARYGGEELMVVLRAASPAAVAEIGERLRRTIASKPLADPDATVAVTVSVGGACYPDHARDAEALVGCADRALYRAKSSGRNRAVIAG